MTATTDATLIATYSCVVTPAVVDMWCRRASGSAGGAAAACGEAGVRASVMTTVMGWGNQRSERMAAVSIVPAQVGNGQRPIQNRASATATTRNCRHGRGDAGWKV